VPELGLALSFRLDALALVMVVLVSGLGALILAHSAWYFGPGEAHSGSEAIRSAALLLAFAGAMLGLVLADNLLIGALGALAQNDLNRLLSFCWSVISAS
jgi:multicomponent Na+:H+ antiporter subunit A